MRRHSSSVRGSRRTRRATNERGGERADAELRSGAAPERTPTASIKRPLLTIVPSQRFPPATGLAGRVERWRVLQSFYSVKQRAIAAMTPVDLKTRPLVFNCPNTGLPLITHILVQSGDASAVQEMRFTVRCACCGSAHEVDGADCRKIRSRAWRRSTPRASQGA
jgi:hypothetical protein